MDLNDVDPEDIVEAVAEGGRRALLAHKLAGQSIAVWRDGKVVVVPPDQIVIPEPAHKQRLSSS